MNRELLGIHVMKIGIYVIVTTTINDSYSNN